MVPLPVAAPADPVPVHVVNLHEGAPVLATAAITTSGPVPGDAGGLHSGNLMSLLLQFTLVMQG